MRNLFCIHLSIPVFMIAAVTLILCLYAPQAEGSVRIKDITRIHDTNELDLLGYGLVIGLDGTGDSKGTQFTMQSLANMMQRIGVTVDPGQLKVKNVAAVIVTTRINSNARTGDRLDATVSSIGDATSLQGGNLLLTPLASATGEVFATAQGPVSIGGFNVQVEGGDKIINNYTVVGRVPGGAQVVNRLKAKNDPNEILLILQSPDYVTADRIARKINVKYGTMSYVEDEATVRVVVPDSLAYPNDRTRLLADIGAMQVNPDQRARVVINERTGTIVAGEHVSIAPVAIAHGNITVSIKAMPVISQPEPFSRGETVVASDYQLSVEDEPARVVHLKETVALADVASALNKIGAAPRDIIAIFEALKQAGALRAELVII
ncbi:MAG: flagellar basal body P-ring protein FlgI [Candidatus Zixiibacteriota bacterium]|nr:MAG: flagellar basal body P-ring protein FlgI [candidate division Zixibacteria bacterium]